MAVMEPAAPLAAPSPPARVYSLIGHGFMRGLACLLLGACAAYAVVWLLTPAPPATGLQASAALRDATTAVDRIVLRGPGSFHPRAHHPLDGGRPQHILPQFAAEDGAPQATPPFPVTARLAGAAALAVCAAAVLLRLVSRRPPVGLGLAMAAATGLQAKRRAKGRVFPTRAPSGKAVYFAEKAKRTVVLSGCPLSVTVGDLKELFPDVDLKAKVLKRKDETMMFVLLPSEAAAHEFLDQTKDLRLGGQAVQAGMAARSREEYKQERKSRTVLLRGCPESTTAEALCAQFPAAKGVVLLRRAGAFVGQCLVLFPTTAEAQAVVAQAEGLEVLGQPVAAEMALVDKATYMLGLTRRTVCLARCPLHTTAEDLQRQFPAAESIEMLPRAGPFGGKCFVRFPTAQAAQAVVATPGLEVNGRRVVARMAAVDKIAYERDEDKRSVMLFGCGPTTTMEDVFALFPNVEEVRMLPRRQGGPLGGSCLLIFPTAEEADAAVNIRSMELNGNPVALMKSAIGKDAYFKLMAERAVILSCCPPATTIELLQQQFPRALEVVGLPKWPGGPTFGRFLVVLPTVAEAEALIRPQGAPDALTVLGQPVLVRQRVVDREHRYKEEATRVVTLYGCPVSTTEEQLEAQFPAAEEITRLPMAGPFSGKCFLLLPTVEAAQALVRTEGLRVNGKPVRAEPKVVDTDRETSINDRTMRAIIVARCPPSVTAAQLQEQFPEADELMLTRPQDPPDTVLLRTFFVVFPTPAVAEAAAAEGMLDVSGHRLVVRLARNPNYNSRIVLMSGCPEVTSAELQELFPTAEEIRLLPKWTGGPFSGRGLLTFATEAAAEAVVQQNAVHVKGQPVLLQMGAKVLAEKEPRRRSVVFTRFPQGSTVEDFNAAFPTAEAIVRLPRGAWYVTFPTVAEAQAVGRTQSVLNGQPMRARWAGRRVSPKAQRKYQALQRQGVAPR